MNGSPCKWRHNVVRSGGIRLSPAPIAQISLSRPPNQLPPLNPSLAAFALPARLPEISQPRPIIEPAMLSAPSRGTDPAKKREKSCTITGAFSRNPSSFADSKEVKYVPNGKNKGVINRNHYPLDACRRNVHKYSSRRFSDEYTTGESEGHPAGNCE